MALENVEPIAPETQVQRNKKRTTDPGVRTKGGRTYDSANGTTCHQCRQKTRDFAAECKNLRAKGQCTIKLCLKCLQNRYGEKAEEVALLSDWNCPKCRGICNCSVCMKKRGKTPTGILVYTAKKSGFSSVSQLLNSGVADDLNGANRGSVTADSDKKILHKSQKEGSIRNKEVNPDSKRKDSKKRKICKESSGKKVAIDEMNSDISFENDVPLDLYPSERIDSCSVSIDGETLQESRMTGALNQDDAGAKQKLKRCRPKKVIEEIQHEEVQSLPQGSDLKVVAGIDLPSELVGQALQFLEFCAAFGEALKLRKGRAESVLREVIQGKDRRRCQYSSTVQFHVQLLTLIQEDVGEKSSLLSPANESPSSSPTDGGNLWLEAFRKCISESEVTTEALPVNLDRYADLDRSEKLRLLNFLCDEALGTDYLRDSIEDQSTIFVEKKKETYLKVAELKDKEKRLKQKLQDEVVANIIVNEAPLSVSKHEAAVAQIKDELAQARAEVLEAMSTLPNRKRCAAHRTEPLLLDDNGRAFWKLNSYEAPDLLVQDLGTWDAIDSKEEKWIAYDAEQILELEKYICAKKLMSIKKKKQKQEAADPVLAGDVEE